MLRRVCHYYSAELPTHCLIKLQFRDRLCIRIRISTGTSTGTGTGTGTGH